jgi:amidase
MAELHDLTALELAAEIRDGETSPTDVVRHALDRAERLGPQVGAYVTLAPERALAEAREAEALLRAATDVDALPPLLGVPCPVKDLNAVAGVPMSAGSRALDGYVPEHDDGIVTLLNQAGTIMLGKTTTPELGLPCYTEPDGQDPARTPWDLARSAGGSSGGAAAAVAARLVPVAQGSDGGGSIRIPASACGLVGLKPSRGRISPGPYGLDGAGLATLGFLTRDVRDTAALLDVAARPWPGDTFELPPAAQPFLEAARRPPGRLRVGVLTTPVIAEGAPVHPACVAAVAAVETELVELGHDVSEAPVPFPAERWDAFRALWSVMALQAPVPPEREDLLVPLTRWLREQGRAVSGLDYAQAVSAVQALTREIARTWASFDVIVSPTLAQLPAPLGSLRDDADPGGDFAAQTRFTPWTSVWNLSGRPAISLPVTVWDDDGTQLPVGVMLGARFGREDVLLGLAGALEEIFGWRDRRPPVA